MSSLTLITLKLIQFSIPLHNACISTTYFITFIYNHGINSVGIYIYKIKLVDNNCLILQW